MNDIYEDNKILRFVITHTYTLNLLLGSTGPTNSEIIPRTGSEHSISHVNLPKLSLPLLVGKFTPEASI